MQYEEHLSGVREYRVGSAAVCSRRCQRDHRPGLIRLRAEQFARAGQKVTFELVHGPDTGIYRCAAHIGGAAVATVDVDSVTSDSVTSVS